MQSKVWSSGGFADEYTEVSLKLTVSFGWIEKKHLKDKNEYEVEKRVGLFLIRVALAKVGSGKVSRRKEFEWAIKNDKHLNQV